MGKRITTNLPRMHEWHAGQTLEKCILLARLTGKTYRFRIIEPNMQVHLVRNEYLRRLSKMSFPVSFRPFAKLLKTLKTLKTPAQREAFSTLHVEDFGPLLSCRR